MQALDRLIETRQEEMIEDLKRLVAIESIKAPGAPGAPFGPGIRAALDLVLDKGRAMGFTVKDVDGYAGHIEYGEGEELVGVLVHLDVVPAGDNWTKPAFGGQIADGRLYGRGAVDDKGPAIACLHAMAALRESGLRPKRRLRLILGCDEESGWECIRHYFEVEERPRYGFSPDAEFPLISAEKGSLALEMKRAWAASDTFRTSIGAMQGGTRHNIVPDNCQAELILSEADLLRAREALSRSGMPLYLTETPGGLLVQARGVAAHAMHPQKGENAVSRLIRGLATLGPMLPKEQGEVLRFLDEEIGFAHDGSAFGLAMSDAVSGPLTLNLGTVAWDKQGVAVQLDVRYPVTAAKEQILGIIEDRARRMGFCTRIMIDIPPLYVPDDHPLVAKLARVFMEKTGSTARPLAIGGRTYACAIGTGVAYGPAFPGSPDLAHQRDEYIGLDELLLCAKIYAGAMAALVTE